MGRWAKVFNFSQGDDGTTRIARLTIPGCGRNEKDDAPILLVEVQKDGGILLKVYGDIKSTEPTHEIPLGGAKLSLKEKEDGGKAVSETPGSSD